MWIVNNIWNSLKSPLLEKKRAREDLALILVILSEQDRLNGSNISCRMKAHDSQALPKGQPSVYALLNILEEQGKITHIKEVCGEGQPERKVYSLMRRQSQRDKSQHRV